MVRPHGYTGMSIILNGVLVDYLFQKVANILRYHEI